MMKRYIMLVTSVMTVLVVLSSCDKFLDDTPTDRVDVDKVFNSEKDLWLNAVYSIYREVGGYEESQGIQGTGRGVYDLNTFCTDEAIIPTRGADWYDGGIWQNLFLHNFGNVDFTGDTWNYLMSEVIECNESLEHIDEYASKHSGANVDEMRAEVRALRAMFLFYAMDLYGRVPLFKGSEPTTSELKLQPRSTTFKHIVSELQECVSSLSIERSPHQGSYYGRMTQPVVWFLLAKVLLNAEVYGDDDWTDGVRPSGSSMMWTVDGETMNTWRAVEAYCAKIANLGYSLEEEQSSNFSITNDNSIENIFTIPMDKYLYATQYTYQFRSRHYNHAASLGQNGENGPCATIDAMKAFGYGTDNPDKRLYTTYYIDTVYNELTNKLVTLDDGTPLVYYPLKVKLDLSNDPYEKTAGARMWKYEVDATGAKDGKLSDNDIVLYRFADVLLMWCEALLRDGDAGNRADNLLNMVRNRAGMDNRVATLDNVLQERLLELAWEGWRRNDLIRFNQFGRSYTDRPQLDADVHGYTTVYPIPGEALTVSGSEQNPGY